MFFPRLFSTLVAVPLVLLMLFWLSLDGFILLMLGVCLLASWEWGPLAGFTRLQQRVLVTTLIVGLLITLLYWIPITPALVQQPLVQLIVCGGGVWWLVALWLVWRYPRNAALWSTSRCCRLLFGIATIVPFFWGGMVLWMQGMQHGERGSIWWLLYILILTWSADSGAYVMGKCFGKHALTPRVSPGKTWEGLLGGILAALLAGHLFMDRAPLEFFGPGLWKIGTILLVVISSVLGDLSESMLKRSVGLKQSGRLIPGHGGVLDRIDSLTAAIPIFACLLLLKFG